LMVAAEQELFREGVKSVLAQIDWIDLVGEAGDEYTLIDLLQGITTDAVILDCGISNGVDIHVVERVREMVPGVKVLVLAANPDHLDGSVRKAIELGCHGFLLKNIGGDELVRALGMVAEGHHYIQGELIPRLVHRADGPQARLSHADLMVLQHVAKGLGNGEIATLIGVSETTLKSRLRFIYAELDASTRVEAVATALRGGLIE
jgi:DNA-binding NarL/FixJ family response regulator